MEAPAAVPDPQGTVRLPSMLPSLQSPLSLSQLLTEEALQAALEGLPVDIVNKHASEGEDGGKAGGDSATPTAALPHLLRRLSNTMTGGVHGTSCRSLKRHQRHCINKRPLNPLLQDPTASHCTTSHTSCLRIRQDGKAKAAGTSQEVGG